jgi:hypothetical protein
VACAAALQLFLLVFGGFSIISLIIVMMMLLNNKPDYCDDDADAGAGAAMACAAALQLFLLVFGGFFIVASSLPPAWAWVKYISPYWCDLTYIVMLVSIICVILF